MNKLKLFCLIALLVCAGSLAEAQTILTNTTLSSAVSASNVQTILVTSATGITAPSAFNPNAATIIYVDREAMQVEAVSGTQLTVQRGANGTTAKPHASGALVFVVPNYLTTQFGYIPQGSCTRGNELALPRIHFISGTISDCLGGMWVNGDASQTTRQSGYHLPLPVIGASNSGAALGTSTATTQYDTYCTELDLPYSKLLTGYAPHIGATGGTDKWIVALYDSTGNLLTQSAAAGATVSGTAYAWQAEAFTAPFYAVGPAVYYGCVTTNGSTATLDLTVTGKGDQQTTTIKTGTSFVVPTSITAPTSFTTANGPFGYLY